MSGQKKQVEKRDFWSFTPKPLPVPDLGVRHWKERKKQPESKKFETFRTFLVYFLSTFGQILAFFANF